MDRRYITSSLLYAIAGMVLGICMAASKNHGQFVTHAHILLVGFLLSFAYGLCHKLWLGSDASTLAWVQFGAHQAGTFVMSAGLFLLYGQYLPADTVEPFLSVASPAVLLGAVLMTVLFLRSGKPA